MNAGSSRPKQEIIQVKSKATKGKLKFSPRALTSISGNFRARYFSLFQTVAVDGDCGFKSWQARAFSLSVFSIVCDQAPHTGETLMILLRNELWTMPRIHSISVFSYKKNIVLSQQNLNSDRQNSWHGRWPVDLHHVPRDQNKLDRYMNGKKYKPSVAVVGWEVDRRTAFDSRSACSWRPGQPRRHRGGSWGRPGWGPRCRCCGGATSSARAPSAPSCWTSRSA